MLTRDLLTHASRPIRTATLLRRWETYARADKQLIHPARLIVHVKAGRGFGKTRTGNEHTLTLCERWGGAMFGLVASKTEDYTIETLVLGESGLVRCARARGYELDYLPGRGVILHPSGAHLMLGTGEDADLGRSKSLNYALLDELMFWKYAEHSFTNIRAALRKPAPSPHPHILVTSSPSYLQKLRLDDEGLVQTIRGRSAENRANAAKGWIEQMERTYAGHPMGAQELDGDDINLTGAITTLARIHELRVTRAQVPVELDAVRMYIDPGGFAIKDPLKADPSGIVVLALAGEDIYVLHAEGVKGDETVWAPRAAELAVGWGVGKIKLETNQGGAAILNTMARALAHRRIPIEAVHASMSKLDRALPTAQQYNLGRLHHVGVHKDLETEATTWGPKSGRPSPNILDALAHGVNDILPDTVGQNRVGPLFPPDEVETDAADAAMGWVRDYFSVD